MHLVITTRWITNAGILNAGSVMPTTLVRIHRCWLNRFARKCSLVDLAPRRWPCWFGHNSWKVPRNRFRPHPQRCQSSMRNSPISYWWATSQPRNVRLVRLSSVRWSLMRAKSTSPLQQEAADGTPLIFNTTVTTRIRFSIDAERLDERLQHVPLGSTRNTPAEYICR